MLVDRDRGANMSVPVPLPQSYRSAIQAISACSVHFSAISFTCYCRGKGRVVNLKHDSDAQFETADVVVSQQLTVSIISLRQTVFVSQEVAGLLILRLPRPTVKRIRRL